LRDAAPDPPTLIVALAIVAAVSVAAGSICSRYQPVVSCMMRSSTWFVSESFPDDRNMPPRVASAM